MRFIRYFTKYPVVTSLVFIGIIYTIFLFLCNGNFLPTGTAYYNRLVEALLERRYDIYPVNTYDLSFFQGKWYLYWGPSPVLFVLPFYLIWKTGASDIIYGFVAGILNVLIFIYALHEFVLHFKIKLSGWSKAFLVICFALISPNFFLSMGGSIWFINQIIAAFFLLMFLLCYFLYLTKKNFLFVILSVIFFNLAWMARLSLLFYGILFLYPVYLSFKYNKRLFVLTLITIIIICLSSVYAYGKYNYRRFGDYFDIGYKHQIAAQRYSKQFQEGKMFSPQYIPNNLYYYYVHPIALQSEKPLIKIDIEGNSMILVYPWILLMLYFFKKNPFLKKHKLFLLLCSAALSVNLLVILSNVGTGYKQFGSRYFFDLIPLLLLLLAFVIEKVNKKILIGMVIYGVIINLLGVYIYYSMYR